MFCCPQANRSSVPISLRSLLYRRDLTAGCLCQCHPDALAHNIVLHVSDPSKWADVPTVKSNSGTDAEASRSEEMSVIVRGSL